MSEYLDSEHTMVVIDTPDLAKALYNAVDARDLPGMADVDSSLLLFCKEIKKHCTVALSGECADEIFGGYPWYRDKKIRAINGFPWYAVKIICNSVITKRHSHLKTRIHAHSVFSVKKRLHEPVQI